MVEEAKEAEVLLLGPDTCWILPLFVKATGSFLTIVFSKPRLVCIGVMSESDTESFAFV